jgi:hypothetical protein
MTMGMAAATMARHLHHAAHTEVATYSAATAMAAAVAAR